MENYYEILGVSRDATKAEIKKAYFKLIRQYSPEKEPEMFQKIRRAYEALQDGENMEKGPSFPAPGSPFEEMTQKELEQYLSQRNWNQVRTLCEQAVEYFPEAHCFAYYLAMAQRNCGNTGKAVKSAERLVELEPENKWFWRELGLSYFERGYVKKAFPACRKAHEMGCRDEEFLEMFAMECKHCEEREYEIKLILELVQAERKWGREDFGRLLYYYCNLFSADRGLGGEMFGKIADACIRDFDKYAFYVKDNFRDAREVLYFAAEDDVLDASEKMDKVRELLRIVKKCAPGGEKEAVQLERSVFGRMASFDERLSRDIQIMLEAFILLPEEEWAEERTLRFARTDAMLCMIEGREEVLKGAGVLKADYPVIYEETKEVFDRLSDEKNLEALKQNLLREMKRMNPAFSGSCYQDYYPEMAKALQERVFYSSLEEETPYVRQDKKIGRNDPCPCGSGLKYKKCCMLKNG